MKEPVLTEIHISREFRDVVTSVSLARAAQHALHRGAGASGLLSAANTYDLEGASVPVDSRAVAITVMVEDAGKCQRCGLSKRNHLRDFRVCVDTNACARRKAARVS